MKAGLYLSLGVAMLLPAITAFRTSMGPSGLLSTNGVGDGDVARIGTDENVKHRLFKHERRERVKAGPEIAQLAEMLSRMGGGGGKKNDVVDDGDDDDDDDEDEDEDDDEDDDGGDDAKRRVQLRWLKKGHKEGSKLQHGMKKVETVGTMLAFAKAVVSN